MKTKTTTRTVPKIQWPMPDVSLAPHNSFSILQRIMGSEKYQFKLVKGTLFTDKPPLIIREKKK